MSWKGPLVKFLLSTGSSTPSLQRVHVPAHPVAAFAQKALSPFAYGFRGLQIISPHSKSYPSAANYKQRDNMTSRNTTAPTSLISPIPDAGLSESAPPPLLPEALAYLPHDDRGPVIVGSVWLMIGVASIFLGLRLFCKHVGRRALWWDDWILIVSWVRLPRHGL